MDENEKASAVADEVFGSEQDSQAADTTQEQTQEQTTDSQQTDTVATQRINFLGKEYTEQEAKDILAAYENRSKWQGELTRKSQEFAGLQKDYEVRKQWTDFLFNPNVSYEEKIAALEKAGVTRQKAVEMTNQAEEGKNPLEGKVATLEQRIATFERMEKQRGVETEVQKIAAEVAQIKAKHSNLSDEDIDTIKAKQYYLISSGKWNNETLSQIADSYVDHLKKREEGVKKVYVDGKMKDKDNKAFQSKGGALPGKPAKPMTEDERRESLGRDIFGAGE